MPGTEPEQLYYSLAELTLMARQMSWLVPAVALALAVLVQLARLVSMEGC